MLDIIQTYGLQPIRGNTPRQKASSLFNNVVLNAPFQGPPIPAGLGVYWGWTVRGKMPGVVVRSSIRGYDQVTRGVSDLIAGEKPYFKNPWKWI
jgi:hypothetical protein